MKLLQLFTLLIGVGAALAASSGRPVRSLHTPKGKESFLSCHSPESLLLIIVDYFVLHAPQSIFCRDRWELRGGVSSCHLSWWKESKLYSGSSPLMAVVYLASVYTVLQPVACYLCHMQHQLPTILILIPCVSPQTHHPSVMHIHIEAQDDRYTVVLELNKWVWDLLQVTYDLIVLYFPTLQYAHSLQLQFTFLR